MWEPHLSLGRFRCEGCAAGPGRLLQPQIRQSHAVCVNPSDLSENPPSVSCTIFEIVGVSHSFITPRVRCVLKVLIKRAVPSSSCLRCVRFRFCGLLASSSGLARPIENDHEPSDPHVRRSTLLSSTGLDVRGYTWLRVSARRSYSSPQLSPPSGHAFRP